MTAKTIGLILGGLTPALLLGVFGVLQKVATKAGAGLAWYFIGIGAGVLAVGIGVLIAGGRSEPTVAAVGWAVLTGLCWASAVGLISFSIARYDVSISQLAPLYNMNTLTVIILGFVVFAEWRNIRVPRLLAGAVLITLGGVLTARA